MADRGRRSREFWRGTTSQRIRALLAMGAVLGLGAVGTMALWSDSSTATSGNFTTGTVDIKLGNPAVDNDPAQFTTDLAMSNMAPGSQKDAVLRVDNAGSLPITYTVDTVGNGDATLAAALQVSVYAQSSGGACTGSATAGPASLTGPLLTVPQPLAANTTQDWCFRVALPTTADSSLQGRTATLTLTFNATNG